MTYSIHYLAGVGAKRLGLSAAEVEVPTSDDGPITISMKESASPALITPTGDDAATFVLSPMRV